MSIVKSKYEERTILDFSKGKYSKNYIRNSLSQADVREVASDPTRTTFIENFIKVGMYEIQLGLRGMPTPDRTHLKDYGGFYINILEPKQTAYKMIDLTRDERFKHQSWIKSNTYAKLNMVNLTDIIMYLKRLDNLKLFL